MENHSTTRIHNRLTGFGLKDMSSVEQNLWWAIVKLLLDKGAGPVHIDRGEIEALSGYNKSDKSIADFIDDTTKMAHKIVSLTTDIKCEDGDGNQVFSLFPSFKIKSEGVIVEISDKFLHWFNDLQSNFTRLDFTVLLKLRSKYTKEMYKNLMRNQDRSSSKKYPGKWIVRADDFQSLLNFPRSYAPFEIKRKIIDPAFKELMKKDSDGWAPIESREIEVIKEKYNKRKVKCYIFRFKTNPPTKKMEDELKTYTNELLPISHEDAKEKRKNAPYSNVFKSGYIEGENSSVGEFMNWVDNLNLDSLYPAYFSVRTSAKNEISNLYKYFVDNAPSGSYWTDMTFLASLLVLIQTDKGITKWRLEDIFANIMKKKNRFSIDIDTSIFAELPREKQGELLDFIYEGRVKKKLA